MGINVLSERESCSILGVSIDASHDEIIAARRRLARSSHPDRGGSHNEMVRLNEACRVLLALRARDVLVHGPQDRSAPVQGAPAPGAPHTNAAGGDSEDRRRSRDEVTKLGFRDAPSFVINSLPVDAFQILLVAASNLGEVVDEDEPYLLEVLIRDPGPLWCRFELFPDAGSTTVIMSCDVEVGYRMYSVEEIRDLWIATINSTSMSD